MKIAITLAMTIACASSLSAETKPYAGLETRGIAALSQADIDDLLAGRGWGFALPAELNGYPGPTHVLELENELGLSLKQRADIEAIRAQMAADARRLGDAFVQAEAALDQAFADKTITKDTLARLTASAAGFEAELRAVHLAAHLEVTPILTRHQIVTYNRLRGYDGGADDGDHSGHGNH